MRQIISISIASLIFFSFQNITAQNQWEYVYPYPMGFNLYSASRDQAGNIYLFGASWTVLYSDARMKTWITLNSNFFEDFYTACSA